MFSILTSPLLSVTLFQWLDNDLRPSAVVVPFVIGGLVKPSLVKLRKK